MGSIYVDGIAPGQLRKDLLRDQGEGVTLELIRAQGSDRVDARSCPGAHPLDDLGGSRSS